MESHYCWLSLITAVFQIWCFTTYCSFTFLLLLSLKLMGASPSIFDISQSPDTKGAWVTSNNGVPLLLIVSHYSSFPLLMLHQLSYCSFTFFNSSFPSSWWHLQASLRLVQMGKIKCTIMAQGQWFRFRRAIGWTLLVKHDRPLESAANVPLAG